MGARPGTGPIRLFNPVQREMFRARVYRLVSCAGGSLMLYGHQGQTWRLEEYWRLNQTFQVCGPVLIGALLLALTDLALANWWIVRASDKKCLVVEGLVSQRTFANNADKEPQAPDLEDRWASALAHPAFLSKRAPAGDRKR